MKKTIAKARKSMRDFIKENKDKIVTIIFDIHPELKKFVKTVSRKECQIMIKNEPKLALLAKNNGVIVASKLKL